MSILKQNNRINKKNTPTSIYDYKGTSKAMETYGINKILENCLKDKLNIEAYVHDDDGGGRNIFLQKYPESMELLDIGHA